MTIHLNFLVFLARVSPPLCLIFNSNSEWQNFRVAFLIFGGGEVKRGGEKMKVNKLVFQYHVGSHQINTSYNAADFQTSISIILKEIEMTVVPRRMSELFQSVIYYINIRMHRYNLR